MLCLGGIIFRMNVYEAIYVDFFKNNNSMLLKEYVDDNIPIYCNDKVYYIENLKEDFDGWCLEEVRSYISENIINISFVPVKADNTYIKCSVEFVFSDNKIFPSLKKIYINDALSAHIFFGEKITPVSVDVNMLFKTGLINNVAYSDISLVEDEFNTYCIMRVNKKQTDSVFNNLSYTTPSSTGEAVKAEVLKITQVEDFKTIGRIYIDNITYKSFLKNNKGKSSFLNMKMYYITQKKSDAAFVCMFFPERVELSH